WNAAGKAVRGWVVVATSGPYPTLFLLTCPRLIWQSASLRIDEDAAASWRERLIVRLESPVRAAGIRLRISRNVRSAVRCPRKRALDGRCRRLSWLGRQRRNRRGALLVPRAWFGFEVALCFFHP